jgi:hypothetical protein
MEMARPTWLATRVLVEFGALPFPLAAVGSDGMNLAK